MITSTLLTLVVVPVIYTYIDAFEQRLKARLHGATREWERRRLQELIDEERSRS